MPAPNSVDINIVIPMAGRGARFAARDYAVPKPFVEFKGCMMIEHVLEGLMIGHARHILIVRSDFEAEHAERLERIQSRFAVSFLAVVRVTQGAACTALAAHRLINSAAPVLFADADNIFRVEDIRAFISDARQRDLDGALLTIHADSPAYSYARLDGRGLVCETREKSVISNHAVAGAYYFARGSDFVDAAIDMLIYGDTQKGEYYISNVYNHLIAKGKTVGVFQIPTERYCCVGTPEQLEAYLRDC